MGKHLKLFIAVAVLLEITTGSCNKRDKLSTPFVLKGYLYDSCGGRPLVNVPLQVSFKSDRLLYAEAVDDDNVGNGVTNKNGYFEFSCKRYVATGSFNLFNADTRFVYSEGLPIATIKQELDIGIGYSNGLLRRGNAEVTLSGLYSVSDTFYIGRPNGAYEYYTDLFDGKKVLYLRNEKAPYAFSKAEVLGTAVYWGIGKNNFNAYKAYFNCFLYPCYMPDTTTYITLSK